MVDVYTLFTFYLPSKKKKETEGIIWFLVFVKDSKGARGVVIQIIMCADIRLDKFLSTIIYSGK